MIRSVDQDDVVTHMDLRFLQIFIWEWFVRCLLVVEYRAVEMVEVVSTDGPRRIKTTNLCDQQTYSG